VGAVTATVVAGVDAVAAAGVPCRVGAEAWMDAVAEWRGTKPLVALQAARPNGLRIGLRLALCGETQRPVLL